MEADNLIPLSALSQYFYCPRRAGLILLENAWADNKYTIEGSAGHERVHRPNTEKRGDLIHLYDMPVFSQVLGLSGQCDLLEVHAHEEGCPLPGLPLRYALTPVEFKHGTKRREHEYEVQVCAQALCLEEMMDTTIEAGYIFYLNAHRRVKVEFTAALRKDVRKGAMALHHMMQTGQVPPGQYTAKCRKCSLLSYCLPKTPGKAGAYCQKVLSFAEEEGGEGS